MGWWRLLRRRLFVHPVALAAVVIAVLMSMTVVATLRLLATDIADAGIRTTLDVPERERTVSASAYLTPAELAGADRILSSGLSEATGDPHITRVTQLMSRGIDGRDPRDRAQLAEIDGLDRAATLTSGRWPVAARPGAGASTGPPVEVALPERAAQELAWSIGSTLVLTDLIDATRPPLTVVLVGTYVPRDPGAAIWLDEPLSLSGVTRTEFTTYGGSSQSRV
jgi:threonine dehydrogenase-like Zn-dependent dehydrogenase